jgi:hypothetical protein
MPTEMSRHLCFFLQKIVGSFSKFGNLRYINIKCNILIDPIDLLKLYFVSRKSILSMHVCRATIQDCKKKYFKIPERISDF